MKRTACSNSPKLHKKSSSFVSGAPKHDQIGKFLRSIFFNSPIGLYVVQYGTFRMVNSEFVKSTGYSEKELIGKKSLSVVLPEDRAIVRENAVRMLKGELYTPYEFRIVRKNGQKRWIMETVSSFLFEGTQAVLGNFMDVTAQKESAVALKQSEKLYRAVVEQATEVIYLIDAKTKNIIKTNSAFQRVLGYNNKDLKSLSIYDLIAINKKDVNSHFQLIMGQGERFLGERTYRHKKGHLIDMEVSGHLINYSGREAVCVVARDITERKRVEQENKFLTHSLISVAEEERKKLARDLHDELGQTLTALRFWFDAYQHYIPDELGDLKKKGAELNLLIDQFGDSIRNILVELRPAMLDDLGLIPTLHWYIAYYMKHQRGIQVRFQHFGFKRRLNSEIEIALFRVFQECLNNIIKHAEAKHIEVSLTYSHPKIIFMIKDDGVGFDQKNRLSLSSKNKPGIGLMGMRERVASLGGSIEVLSRLGKGTVIRIELVARP